MRKSYEKRKSLGSSDNKKGSVRFFDKHDKNDKKHRDSVRFQKILRRTYEKLKAPYNQKTFDEVTESGYDMEECFNAMRKYYGGKRDVLVDEINLI